MAERIFEQLVGTSFPSDRWTYGVQQCALYALGLGCTAAQPHRTYESHADFAALPSLPVLAQYQGSNQAAVLSAFQVGRLALRALVGAALVRWSGACVRTARLTRGPAQATLPGFNSMLVLHGEEFVELHAALPTEATVTIRPRIVEVRDRGKASTAVIERVLEDAQTGQPLATVETTAFFRGAGGWDPSNKAARLAKRCSPPRASSGRVRWG